MRIAITTLIILSTFILFRACDNSRQTSYSCPKELKRINVLCEENPDSALNILSSYKPQNVAEADECYLYFLYLKANCKRKISYTMDTKKLQKLITDCEYYKFDDDNLGDLYYYSGCIYRNLNDDPQAMSFYLKALNVYGRIESKKMLGRVNTQIGNILINQCLYKDAEKYLKKGFSNSRIAGDTHWACYALRDLAWCQSSQKKYNMALITYKKALRAAQDTNDKAMTAYIYTQYASLLFDMRKYKEAESAILKALEYNAEEDRSPNLCILVKIYNETGRQTETIKYCKELMSIGNIYGRQLASVQLAKYYMKKDVFEKSSKYYEMAIMLADSIRNRSAEESVAKMSAAYNYNNIQKQKYELEDTKQKQQIIIIIISFALILIVLIFIYIRKSFVHQRNEQKLRNLALETILKTNKKQMVEESECHRERMEKMEAAMKLKDNEILTLRNDVKLNDNSNKNASLFNIIDIDEQIISSDIYKRFFDISKSVPFSNTLNDDDWKELEKLVYGVYPNMENVVLGMKNMTMVNKRITLLLRIGFRPAVIAKLLFKEKSSINSARKRLYEKNFSKVGVPADWDNFIMAIH